ncbi:MAG: extracellular solute-binding protein, partial [Clostridiales bacterium]|nr:extracellular solute-binding protein [Clostridiales bacterium]
MKRLFLKLCSLVMIMSVALSIFSCGKTKGNKRDAEIIAEDSPWFESEVIKVDLGIDTSKELSTYEAKMIGFDDKYLVILFSGTYWSQSDTNAGDPFANISILDRETKEVKKFSLTDTLGENDYVDGGSYKDGKLTLQVNTYDPKTYSVSVMDKDVDITTGEILDSRKHNISENNYSAISYEIGEYIVETNLKGMDTNPKVVLTWSSSAGDKNQVEIKGDNNILYGVPVILPITDTRILVPVYSERDTLFYEIDLKEGTLKDLDAKDYEWLRLEEMGTTFTGTDGKTYYTKYNGKGISCIDFDNKTIDTFLDFNWCDVDLNVLSKLNMIENDGKSVTLAGSVESRFRLSTDNTPSVLDYYIVELTKVEKNPHAGKTVLSLYMGNETGFDEVTDAILEFNNSSTEFYIKITDKYSKDYTVIREAKSNEEYRLASLNSDNDMSNQLTMDIINGTGPDIYVNTSNLGVLNNDNYLVDLSSYFKDLDSSKFFTNIVEASKVDDKLYQLPVCYRIEGIETKSELVGTSGVGFTLEEYKEFVQGPLNGNDIIRTGQAFYFTRLFNNMSDKFIINGKADFSCPEFAELASYVNDNVQDKRVSDDNENESSDELIASGVTCYGISKYFGELVRFNGDLTITGLPSCDGRGPQFDAWVSVAVSAQSTDVNACAEFAKLLLSDDIQT